MHSHSRRGFLSRMLGAAWASASLLERAAFVAARARAQSKEPLPTLFDIEKQADGIYAAVARGRALINCNAAIFENEKDLLIVDAHSAPSAVFALVAQIRREITQKPVRYVVATHVHGDHTQGLAGYREISPSVDMIASAKTRSVLAQSGAARLKSAVDGAGRSLENLNRRLAQAKTAEEKAWTGEMIRQTRAFQEEMRNVPLELPNVTFDDQLTPARQGSRIAPFVPGQRTHRWRHRGVIALRRKSSLRATCSTASFRRSATGIRATGRERCARSRKWIFNG